MCRAWQEAQALGLRVLIRSLKDQLHPNTYGQQWLGAVDHVSGYLVQPTSGQFASTASEGTNTGQHRCIRVANKACVIGEARVGTSLLKCLLNRSEVPDPIVKDRHERTGHKTPLVDGTVSDSTRTASRTARATALKLASTM